MGGDTISTPTPSVDEEEELQYPNHLAGLPTFLRMDGLKAKLGGQNEPLVGESDYTSRRISCNPLEMEARRKRNVYAEILRSYDELQTRIDSLEDAKSKILSYTPGAWVEMFGGMKLSDYIVPKTTALLLVGPKGSGKSSLVNRVSRVFDDDKFASERAQVSYNSSFGDGTYFLQEYMIPRGSTSFCLYDTRSLSDDSTENMKLLKHWMTEGVRHGELVTRGTDSSSLKTRMKCKARQNYVCSCESSVVNFVIVVVNGLSVLKCIADDGAETQYAQRVATVFNYPFLSFKDDKPVVVVTHGDLLSLSDRAHIRVYLAEQLGIHPKKQIFDIPESCEPATELVIVDMLRYALEHADRNLPGKGRLRGNARLHNVRVVPLHRCVLLLLVVLGIAVIAAHSSCPFLRTHPRPAPEPKLQIDWHAIRHLWLGDFH